MFGFIALCKVAASSVSSKTKAVLLNLAGPGGAIDLQNPDREEAGETATAQPEFGALGMVGRPPPPSKVDGRSAYTEAFAVRTGDALVPVAYRDLRWNAFYPSPKPGTIANVGWGGAFDSNEATLSSSGAPQSSVRTIYVPYAFSGSTPTKAHCVTVDGTAGNESISIVHGDGMAICINDGGIVIRNAAGNAYLEVNSGGVVINGNTVLNGGATIGSPTGALPVALAPALAAWTSAVVTWSAAVATALNSLVPGSVPGPVVPPAPFAATKLNGL